MHACRSTLEDPTDDINGLVGQRLAATAVNALVARIEAEHPDMVAAARDSATPKGTAHVVFVVARISDDTELATDINTRYTVERVEIDGIDESRISQALRDELQTLVGRRLDNDEADALAARLKAEQPDYSVGRRVSKGSGEGRLRVVFRFELSEDRLWVPRPPSRTKLVFHEDQGWSGVLEINVGDDGVSIGPSLGGRHQATFGFAFGNQDDLIEEYSGQRIRFVTRQAGSRRLGLSFDLARFTNTWKDATLLAVDADPSIPAAYRERVTIEPSITFALNRYARFTAGVSVSDLEPLAESAPTGSARVAMASAGFDRTWRSDPAGRDTDIRDRRQRLQASYELRTAAGVLDSDLEYTRHLGRASYEYRYAHNTVRLHAQFGRLTGEAPLFERFTLGDTSTLRGWNKLELAPAGATRMAHTTAEYRFSRFGLAYFIDAGSLWEPGDDVRLRLATGVGLHGDNAFLTVGFPLNGGGGATFMIGVGAEWGSGRWGF